MPERPLVTVMPGCVPHRRQPNGTDVREFAESWRLIHRGLVDASICAGQSTFADAVNKPHGVARLDMVLPRRHQLSSSARRRSRMVSSANGVS